MHEIRTARIKTRGNRLEAKCSCRRWEFASTKRSRVTDEIDAEDMARATEAHALHLANSRAADIAEEAA